jgi:hypothetical protein
LTPDQIYTRLSDAESRGSVMMADTFGNERDYKADGLPGLVNSHSYAILGVKEVDGQRYVTVRNPWGKGEVGADGKDDGVFDLKVEDFARAFHYLDVTNAPLTPTSSP